VGFGRLLRWYSRRSYEPAEETSVPERTFDVRSALLDNLLSKVEEDPFPSLTMLDMIEELLQPEDLPKYAKLLLSKVADERFPSVSMLARIRDLA
jgi:hypothetical protein